jgi:hypothetical protein
MAANELLKDQRFVEDFERFIDHERSTCLCENNPLLYVK